MKIDLKKIATALGDVTTALTSGDKEVALAKLAEATTDLEAASAEQEAETAEAAKTEETIQNAVDKAVEVSLKKYADMFIAADNFKQLIEEIKAVTDKVVGLETLAKTTEETLTKIANTEVGSRQNEEDIKNTAKNPLAGLAERLA